MRKAILIVVSCVVFATAALFFAPKRWFYHNRRPTTMGKGVNRLWTLAASLGATPSSWPGAPRIGTVGLEVMGRKSNRRRSTVVTWVELDGQRYFVSMLGERSDWVRNVRAANGRANIRHRGRKRVLLEEVPVHDRANVLRAYLTRTAIATRRHLGIDATAPIYDFERIAPAHPVFRVAIPSGN